MLADYVMSALPRDAAGRLGDVDRLNKTKSLAAAASVLLRFLPRRSTRALDYYCCLADLKLERIEKRWRISLAKDETSNRTSIIYIRTSRDVRAIVFNVAI